MIAKCEKIPKNIFSKGRSTLETKDQINITSCLPCVYCSTFQSINVGHWAKHLKIVPRLTK